MTEKQRAIADALHSPVLRTVVLAPDTRATYLRCLRKYHSWFFQPDIMQRGYTYCCRNSVGLFDSTVLSKMSRTSRGVYIAAIKTYAKAVGNYELLGMRVPRYQRKSPRKGLTSEQLSDVLGAATALGLRTLVAVELEALYGLRGVELDRLRYEDCESGGIWVQGKGRRYADTYIELDPQTWQALIQLREHYPYKPFPARRQLRTLVTQALKAANVYQHGKVNAHALRHTFAQLAAQAGAQMHDIRHALRHSRTETTSIYLGTDERPISEVIRMGLRPPSAF